jgi:hypothetical protein
MGRAGGQGEFALLIRILSKQVSISKVNRQPTHLFPNSEFQIIKSAKQAYQVQEIKTGS